MIRRDSSRRMSDRDYAAEGDGPVAADGVPADRDPGPKPPEEAVPGDDRAPRFGPWREYLLLAGVCVLALVLVNAFIGRPYVVPSGSMENTLRVGDRLVVDKLAYAFGGHVRRGDVVVFDGHGSFLDDDSEPSGGGVVRELGAYLGLVPFPDSDYV